MKYINTHKSLSNRGDTIIEVLIAMAVAAFAIGTSYAIANRSLQEAVTARERNEAVNVIQSQIAALQTRFTVNKDAFNPTNIDVINHPDRAFVIPSNIATPPDAQLPSTIFHFCLDEQSGSQTDTTHQWQRYDNTFGGSKDPNDINPADGSYGYNQSSPNACKKTVGGIAYFVDISAQITSGSKNDKDRTVYKVAVRWQQLGNGNTAQAGVYYRIQ